MASSVEHELPAGIGVKQYTVRRDRAEVSFITLECYDEGAKRWLTDNHSEPEERKDIDVPRPLKYPEITAAGNNRIRLRLSGQWKPDDSHVTEFDHIDVDQARDLATFLFYAKKGDPSATVVARVVYDRLLPLD